MQYKSLEIVVHMCNILNMQGTESEVRGILLDK